jgi:hypothetical protein
LRPVVSQHFGWIFHDVEKGGFGVSSVFHQWLRAGLEIPVSVGAGATRPKFLEHNRALFKQNEPPHVGSDDCSDAF